MRTCPLARTLAVPYACPRVCPPRHDRARPWSLLLLAVVLASAVDQLLLLFTALQPPNARCRCSLLELASCCG